MGKRLFRLELRGTVVIELDDSVIDVVDDDWRGYFYSLRTPEQIAEMVGRCMATQNCSLSSLDGWADQPDTNARIVQRPEWETEEVEELPIGTKLDV